MDKQTLSNYGWLVIVTLVLAIMLALATPFGSYVGDAVVNVANGIASTNEDATNEENITQESVEWSVKTDHGIDYNTFKYYNSIEDAITDLNNGDLNNGSDKLSKYNSIVIATNDNIPVLRLIKDITISNRIDIKNNVILDINDKTININFEDAHCITFNGNNFKITSANKGYIVGTKAPYSIIRIEDCNSDVKIENIEAKIECNNLSTRFFMAKTGSGNRDILIKNCNISILNTDQDGHVVTTSGANTSIKIQNCNFNINGINDVQGCVFWDSDATICNSTINVTGKSTSVNEFAMCVVGTDGGTLSLDNVKINMDVMGNVNHDVRPFVIGCGTNELCKITNSTVQLTAHNTDSNILISGMNDYAPNNIIVDNCNIIANISSDTVRSKLHIIATGDDYKQKGGNIKVLNSKITATTTNIADVCAIFDAYDSNTIINNTSIKMSSNNGVDKAIYSKLGGITNISNLNLNASYMYSGTNKGTINIGKNVTEIFNKNRTQGNVILNTTNEIYNQSTKHTSS